MKYRSHRGSLEESMNTVIEIENINQLQDYLQEQENKIFKRKIVEVVIDKEVVYDKRIDWNQSWVYIKYENNDDKYIQGLIDITK